jgi:hypothetical protein
MSKMLLTLLLDIFCRGFFTAVVIALLELVVNGVHIGDASFIIWWLIGSVFAFLFKLTDFIEIYSFLKERNNDN